MAPAIAAASVATPLQSVPSKAAPSKGSSGKTVAVRSSGADVDAWLEVFQSQAAMAVEQWRHVEADPHGRRRRL